MTISLGQLLAPVTEDEAYETALSILRELGFPVTAWQDGRVQKTRVRLIARLYSQLTQVLVGQQKGGTSDARGAYADLRGQYLYNETREPSEATIGKIHFVSDLTAPALSYDPGEVRIRVGTQTFENEEAISLSPGASGDFSFQAVIPGAAGNVAADSTCTFLDPVVVGVTLTNPEIGETGTWITTQGRDAEEDSRYLTRAQGKIERLAYGATEGAYKLWVLEALPEIPENRVNVIQGEGDGEIEITAATSEGALTGDQITAITDYLDGADGIGRRPINDIVTVGTVTEVSDPSLTLTVYVLKAFAENAEATITEALETYLESLPIGGQVIGAPPGKARQAAMVAAVMAVQGVVNVTGVPSDVTLGSDEIYVPSISLTIEEV